MWIQSIKNPWILKEWKRGPLKLANLGNFAFILYILLHLTFPTTVQKKKEHHKKENYKLVR